MVCQLILQMIAEYSSNIGITPLNKPFQSLNNREYPYIIQILAFKV